MVLPTAIQLFHPTPPLAPAAKAIPLAPAGKAIPSPQEDPPPLLLPESTFNVEQRARKKLKVNQKSVPVIDYHALRVLDFENLNMLQIQNLFQKQHLKRKQPEQAPPQQQMEPVKPLHQADPNPGSPHSPPR